MWGRLTASIRWSEPIFGRLFPTVFCWAPRNVLIFGYHVRLDCDMCSHFFLSALNADKACFRKCEIQSLARAKSRNHKIAVSMCIPGWVFLNEIRNIQFTISCQPNFWTVLSTLFQWSASVLLWQKFCFHIRLSKCSLTNPMFNSTLTLCNLLVYPGLKDPCWAETSK